MWSMSSPRTELNCIFFSDDNLVRHTSYLALCSDRCTDDENGGKSEVGGEDSDEREQG